MKGWVRLVLLLSFIESSNLEAAAAGKIVPSMDDTLCSAGNAASDPTTAPRSSRGHPSMCGTPGAWFAGVEDPRSD